MKKNGLKFLILEAGEHAAGSWPHYYDSLKLFSPVRLSSLPGMRISGAATHYPSQNEVIQYFPIGALGTEGKPIQTAGISLTAPGLYYVGLEGQRSFTSATLRGGGGAGRKIRCKQANALFENKKSFKVTYVQNTSFVKQMSV
nr:hypothetical protein [Paenibacillus lactis]